MNKKNLFNQSLNGHRFFLLLFFDIIHNAEILVSIFETESPIQQLGFYVDIGYSKNQS